MVLGLALASRAHAEDGYALWLRYARAPAAQQLAYAQALREVAGATTSPTLLAAQAELLRGVRGITGVAPIVAPAPDRDGAVVFGTPASSPVVAALRLPLQRVGAEGYVLRRVVVGGRALIVVAGNTDVGVLHGAFALLRFASQAKPLNGLDEVSAPKLKLRVLDHWDNLDRTVERGYAGFSLWDWLKLPVLKDPRYVDYARANASIGVNGVVLNNVNASALSLTPLYLEKTAALADVFRPYGVRVYLSARFSAPIELGGLKTADPLDPEVRAWWRAKADEIYRLVPDFGGFLVKANSEGQPGPQDYGRSHAEGANALAAAVAPHGGVVMYRAFVYSNDHPQDRVKQGFDEFKPLDGAFAPNVLLQIKNGPLDFQPREPFHPLFGALPKTPEMLEVQVTKEYLGFATHLVYLGALWEEVLKSRTARPGPASTVASDLEHAPGGLTGMAGVANVGTDRTWSGSVFDQANWYAFGRLAWDPDHSSRDIAAEWAAQTFAPDAAVTAPVVDMMMRSREAVVDYMEPLGLAHIMARDTHYGPGPWVTGGPRADWTATYYHRADRDGVGFERGPAGSDAVAQYAPEIAAAWARADTTPERLLLWFHHVSWDRRMSSGLTLWEELVARYDEGLAQVAAAQATWAGLQDRIDPERFRLVADDLRIQAGEARWWRDACLAYFSRVGGRPLPPGVRAPDHMLEWYKTRQQPVLPGAR